MKPFVSTRPWNLEIIASDLCTRRRAVLYFDCAKRDKSESKKGYESHKQNIRHELQSPCLYFCKFTLRPCRIRLVRIHTQVAEGLLRLFGIKFAVAGQP